MKKTIFFKSFSGYFFIIIAISFLLVFLSFSTIRNHYIETLKGDLEDMAISLSFEVKDYIRNNRIEELDSFVKEMGKKLDTRITVINPGGVVFADSEENPAEMENHSTRPEILQAYYGKTGSSLRFSETVEKEMLYVAIPLYKEDGSLMVVLRISLFLQQIKTLLTDIKFNVIRIAVILVILSLIGAAVFTKSLTDPIQNLAKASEKVASGNFDVTVYPQSRGELRKFADSFNEMVTRIKGLVTELSQQKESLDAIISSINEGLLVIEEDGKILLSNESFNSIADLEESPVGKYYWEVLRDVDLGEIIREVDEETQKLIREIEIKGEIYICSTMYLTKYRRIVITFHDISEIKNLEKIKKDFIWNVSHELKTPLTAIKGFIETLKSTPAEENKRYADIILRHTDRLINIVNDLLVISELEERRTDFEYERVDLKRKIKDIVDIYRNKAEEKNITLKFKGNNEIPMVEVDSYRIDQVFINLIENSIKYTEQGEIMVSMDTYNEKVEVVVEDTGIGIPEEQIPRIFERFYVVDKSRSKKTGGTGLGLSIVKHIVLLHDGSIDVDSTPGEGTKFTITLPLTQT